MSTASDRSWHRRSGRHGLRQFEVDGEQVATGFGGAERGDGRDWYGGNCAHSGGDQSGRDGSRWATVGRLDATALDALTPDAVVRDEGRG